MTTRHIANEDVLQVIGCEIERRPTAPGINDLAPLVSRVSRSPGALAVEFPSGALEVVEAFAAAERQCCAGIGWQVDAGSVVTLRVTADVPVLDAIIKVFDIERSR